MRIGLIPDTYIPDLVKAFPPQVMEVFSGVDLTLHAGDIYIASVLDELERIAPVLAARGDNDHGLRDKRVEEMQNLTVEGPDLPASGKDQGIVSESFHVREAHLG